ncbi:GNAT family N-acetyltransferase [Methylobacterium sp. J-059]|uniref:GNAT family N-acetyltransferase n=1 Tax=Methylobacterium sp. J-059 TaxID=2836643 RepID=UPI001FBB2335|nr:GNAT family N-acetyltransferase [Methylobacterium sp. J-059]MCJ2041938.1 GNAT family N-acetyltransferase [Methylobacterium sp. J-059]
MTTHPDRSPGATALHDRPAGGRGEGRLRPMEIADVAAVGRLFLRHFRGIEAEPGPDLLAYLRTLAFGAPGQTRETGSCVYERCDGRITSALPSVHVAFRVGERDVAGRLFSAFMTDRSKDAAGAAKISLAMRARHQDLAFNDSSSPTSLKHFQAVGGTIVPIQNLEWIRTFRPAEAALGRVVRRTLRRWEPPLGPLAWPLDAAIRAVRGRSARPCRPDVRVEPMTVDDFLDHAPGLIAHHAVRPRWSRPELAWFVAMAEQNRRRGPLAIRRVVNRCGAVVGCFVYHGAAGRPARVLNVLARPAQEAAILHAMLRHLDEAGCTEAIGHAQPALMHGLAHQRGVGFRHRAFVCVLTRHADIAAAAKRGDIYIGGLAGEDWSRLMSDF